MNAELVGRFMARVSPEPMSGCWLWTGADHGDGYGIARWVGRPRQILAHRAAWLLMVGEIPAGLFVCHRCDNRACVNPCHLFLGTHADNMRDRDSKGRGVVPRTNHRRTGRKLTDSDRAAIRARRNAGRMVRALAQEFGVDKATIYRVTAAVFP